MEDQGGQQRTKAKKIPTKTRDRNGKEKEVRASRLIAKVLSVESYIFHDANETERRAPVDDKILGTQDEHVWNQDFELNLMRN